MCPVGRRCILGYNGNWKPGKFEMLGLPGISELHCCPSQISLVLLLVPSESFNPDVVMMRPSLSSMRFGYHRPCAVGAMSTKDPLEGSKIEAFGRPVNGMSPWVPTTAS